MIKRLTYPVIFVFVLISLKAFSQEEEIQFHKYKNEIAIDIQNLFEGTPGTALTYKKRKPETGLIAVNEKTAYRFQLTLGGNQDIGDHQFDSLNTNLISFNDLNNDFLSLGTAVGIERQINRKQLQYFYGLDAGYTYSTNTTDRYIRFVSPVSGKIQDIRETINSKSHGPALSLFFGFKYFIVPEISLSVESGLLNSFRFIHRDETEVDLSTNESYIVREETYKELSFIFDYLRMLNVSYYF